MSENPLQTASIEDRIAGRIDGDTMRGLSVSSASGGLSFTSMAEVMEFAKAMSIAQIAVRKHLRGNPGACAAVIMQAIEWRMSPYAVANKSYAVNDQLAYEAQLIHAVILQRAPIRGRIKAEYSGADNERVLRVWAILREEDEVVEYTSPLFGKIQPKNSPLWKNDPDQQLFYYSVRALARRHFPDVILGVYAEDELPDGRHSGPDKAKDVTPRGGLNDRLDQIAGTAAAEPSGAVLDHDAVTGEVIEPAPRQRAARAPKADKPAPQVEAKAEPKQNDHAAEAEIVDRQERDQPQGGSDDDGDDFPGDRPNSVQDFADEANRSADEEEERGQSPEDIAYDLGWKAHGDGMSRKAAPPAFRERDRANELHAWARGFDEALAHALKDK